MNKFLDFLLSLLLPLLILPAMRRVIRRVTSHEYFRKGQWTIDPSQAEDFCNSAQAIEACLRYHLRDIELVLQLHEAPEEAYDVHLRLFDEAHAEAISA